MLNDLKLSKELLEFREEMENPSFRKSNQSINTAAYWGSYIGQVFNIALMFLFLYALLDSLIGSKHWFFIGVKGILSFLGLFFIEFIKRKAIYNTAKYYLIQKQIGFKFYLLTIITSFIVILSGYLAISGIQEIADKTKTITEVIEINNDKKLETLKLDYDKDIAKIDKNYTNTYYNKVLPPQLSEYNEKIAERKKEYELEKAKLEIKTNGKKTESLDENMKILLASLILTFFIEITILAGRMFNAYYNWKSNIELNDELKKYEKEKADELKAIYDSSNYKNYEIYRSLLLLIYSDYIPHGKVKKAMALKKLCSKKGYNFTKTDIDSFLTTLSEKECIGPVGKISKTFKKDLNDAQLILKEMYNIKIDLEKGVS